MDVIDSLVGKHIPERAHRPQAKANAQLAFEALLESDLPERYAIAAFVAGLHQSSATDFYVDLLTDENSSLVPQLTSTIAEALSTGPSGTYREPEVQHESEPATWFHAEGYSPRLAAALDYAHLLVFHPRDSRPETPSDLAAHYSDTEIVQISQLISFLAFQLRVVAGLRVIAGIQDEARTPSVSSAGAPPTHLHPRLLTYPDLARPRGFVRHGLGWKPWIAPLEKSELTAEHLDALVRADRVESDYFRLLARDPAALKARTLIDFDIFYNTESGIGRAERELAATVASRFNGCVFCASVHAARTLQESEGREQDIDALLIDGVPTDAPRLADLGSDLWNAIANLTVNLSSTPPRMSAADVDWLRGLGLETDEVIDVVNAAAFFNWANRLMLALGEPELPKRFR